MLLYRAVSQVELLDISITGRFRTGPTAFFGKWFAVSEEAAGQWGSRFSAGEGRPYFIVVASAADIEVGAMYAEPNLDGIGRAVFVETAQLPSLQIVGLPSFSADG